LLKGCSGDAQGLFKGCSRVFQVLLKGYVFSIHIEFAGVPPG
jgi:hypothetical protein